MILRPKTGMFYYTITNIHPALRSRLQTIMLLSVVESKYIEMYGIDEILKPFVSEMMELESVSACLCVCVQCVNLYYSLVESHLK